MRQIYNVILGKTDFEMLNIRPEYLVKLHEVVEEGIHNDPFDHMLIATAKCENIKLITKDKQIERYRGLDVVTI